MCSQSLNNIAYGKVWVWEAKPGWSWSERQQLKRNVFQGPVSSQQAGGEEGATQEAASQWVSEKSTCCVGLDLRRKIVVLLLLCMPTFVPHMARAPRPLEPQSSQVSLEDVPSPSGVVLHPTQPGLSTLSTLLDSHLKGTYPSEVSHRRFK